MSNAGFTKLNDGWYRIFVTVNYSNTSSITGHAANDTDKHGTAYWTGWQVEEGSEVTDIAVNTGNSGSGGPRYSHDPETLVPTGLYLEPEKTLLIRKNIDFTNTTNNDWTLSGSTLTTDSNETNPDGTSGVKVLTATAGTKSGQNSEPRIKATLTNNYNVHRTFSVFVKKKTNRYVGFGTGGTTKHTMYLFDFDTESIGHISNKGASAGEPEHADTVIVRGFKKYPNGWYRLFITSFGNVGNGMQIFVPKSTAHNLSLIHI